jgi:hypothetical protein
VQGMKYAWQLLAIRGRLRAQTKGSSHTRSPSRTSPRFLLVHLSTWAQQPANPPHRSYTQQQRISRTVKFLTFKYLALKIRAHSTPLLKTLKPDPPETLCLPSLTWIRLLEAQRIRSAPSRVERHVSAENPANPVEILWSASTVPLINLARRCVNLFLCYYLASPIKHKFIQNTNVVELYTRLEKSDKQLTYYDSGIGTYVKGSKSLSYLWQVINYTIDMAIAWYVSFPLASNKTFMSQCLLTSPAISTGTSNT